MIAILSDSQLAVEPIFTFSYDQQKYQGKKKKCERELRGQILQHISLIFLFEETDEYLTLITIMIIEVFY